MFILNIKSLIFVVVILFLYGCATPELSPENRFNAGVDVIKRNNSALLDEEAFKHFLYAAEVGIPEAQYFIAQAFRMGTGVKKNKELGVMWTNKAYSTGYIPAVVAYALDLDDQEVCTKKAIELYVKASNFGHGTASYNLGYCAKTKPNSGLRASDYYYSLSKNQEAIMYVEKFEIQMRFWHLKELRERSHWYFSQNTPDNF
ncbi:MAG: tetratricopeptide repeat protein [Pseudomonadota bacterium]